MFPWIGAAGSALSLLNTVLKSTTASGTAQTGNDPFSSLGQALSGNDSSSQTNAVTGSGQGVPSLSSGTLATLIALQGQNGANGQGGVFSRLDADGDGSISKSEFESAASKAGLDTSSADALFGKLDANGDGSISKGEMAQARGAHGHHGGGGGGGGASQLMSGTDAAGATTQTTTNPDGSSTTTITYQDGSTVTTTTPAAASQNSGSSAKSASGTSQNNLLEKLIKMQAQFIGQSSSTSVHA